MISPTNITITYSIEDKAYFGEIKFSGKIIKRSGQEETVENYNEVEIKTYIKNRYSKSVARKINSLARKYRALMDIVNRDSKNKILGRLEFTLTDTGDAREKPDPIVAFPFC